MRQRRDRQQRNGDDQQRVRHVELVVPEIGRVVVLLVLLGLRPDKRYSLLIWRIN